MQNQMNADEESRNRQYFATAISDDEVIKVPIISVFATLAKNNINIKAYHQNWYYLMVGFSFLFAVCDAFFFETFMLIW